MGCYSICVSLLGMEFGSVCSHTQLILFQKHLQDKLITIASNLSANTKVSMVDIIFTFCDDQK